MNMLYIVVGIIALAAVVLLGKLLVEVIPLLREGLSIFRFLKDTPRPVEQKTVFGATSIYLPLVRRDFPDFHNSDAVAAVKTLVCEFLAIRYEGRQSFEKSIVSEGLIAMIDRQPGHTVNDESVHQVAMSNYVKSLECATITYQASVGYLLDGNRVEERYAVEYTMSLRDEYGEKKALICPRCGGAYTSTSQKYCAFCGSGIVRDTVKSWRFTSISLS